MKLINLINAPLSTSVKVIEKTSDISKVLVLKYESLRIIMEDNSVVDVHVDDERNVVNVTGIHALSGTMARSVCNTFETFQAIKFNDDPIDPQTGEKEAHYTSYKTKEEDEFMQKFFGEFGDDDFDSLNFEVETDEDLMFKIASLASNAQIATFNTAIKQKKSTVEALTIYDSIMTLARSTLSLNGHDALDELYDGLKPFAIALSKLNK